jgi:tetratricopeptide (TPR) repeat protein
VQKDPQFAPAWAELSKAYGVAGSLAKLPPSIAWPRTESAAAKALQLDPGQAEAWASLAEFRAFWDLDFAEAERLFRRALDLNPRERSALMGYAVLLQELRRFDESIVISKRLVDDDPLNTNGQWRLANAYLTSGQYDRATQQIALILQMDPNYLAAHVALSQIYIARGQHDQAIAELRLLSEKNHDERSLAFLGYARGKGGREAEARDVLRQLHDRSEPSAAHDYHLAIVYAGLGDRESMFPLLERGLQARAYVVRLNTEPAFEPYRSDPRFVGLLQRAGFKRQLP